MKRTTVCLIILITFVVFVSYNSHAGSNFVVIRLPKGISVDIPRNWQVATKDQMTTLDTTVESQLDLSEFPRQTSDLGFVAGYFDDAGDKAKISVRYYPDMKVTQDSVKRLSLEEMKKFDNAVKQSAHSVAKASGGTILDWRGTRKQNVAGRIALVTEYRHPALPGEEEGNFNVRIIRILNGPKTFTVTVSYNELYKVLYKPICDRIISSLKIEK